ncbi:hypothetical protein OUZ56_017649 [Daphnia magna]|uniref:Uncharacterized protein n=1 Tax=Daphnia magna TaxID=35525 RepID=A0ABR0ATC7_9CRUS|nr:hypothetical protein OUZ56_017649 [Daphnia magna]
MVVSSVDGCSEKKLTHTWEQKEKKGETRKVGEANGANVLKADAILFDNILRKGLSFALIPTDVWGT